jgi:predicted phosphodiesterase
MDLSRRTFIQVSAAGLLSTRIVNWDTASAAPAQDTVRFGLSADIHKDIIHDADERLQAFIDDMKNRDLDFILDLGDFCQPRKRNEGFRDIFHSHPSPKYHVLGNHEIDGGYTWQQSMDFFSMKAPYYSFDQGGYHFIVLDGNNKPEGHTSGYPSHIGQVQLDWLKGDITKTQKPTFVFSHQCLHGEDGGSIDNSDQVQAILEAKPCNIIACLCGHRHVDEHVIKNGIHYININSMSYYWVGSKYNSTRYSPEIESAHPHLKHTIPYDSPLYTVFTIKPTGELMIEGQSGQFVPPLPKELGMPLSRPNGTPLSASIIDREISIDLGQ